MVGITTGTAEPATDAGPKEPAAGACLGGIGRIHEGEAKAQPLGFVPDSRQHRVIEPVVQFPPRSLADMVLPGLGFDFQILKYQDGVGGNPFTEAGGGFLAECQVTVSCFPGQPFQHPAHRRGVLVFCLPPGEFRLETGSSFPCLGVVDGEFPPADEQGFVVGGCHQGVVDAEVDSHGGYPNGVGDFKCQAQRGPAVTLDADGVVDDGVVEVGLKSLGDSIGKVFPAVDGGDGEFPFSEGGVPAPLLDEEQSGGFPKLENPGSRPLIAPGGGIGGGREPDGGAFQLGREHTIKSVVDRLVQTESLEGVAAIETNGTDLVLEPVEFLHRLQQVDTILYKDWNCSCDLHIVIIHHYWNDCKRFSGEIEKTFN